MFDMKKNYCFTIDDNIRFLEEATRAHAASIFEVPYMKMLYRLHRQFAAKFQLNMFYRYEEGGFSLADAPDIFRSELEAASDWLKFSFHALQNEPPFPYLHAI